MDIITLSIPIFLGLVLLELAVVLALRRPLYRWHDSLNDLSCGILSQLSGIFFVVLTVGAYQQVWTHARLQLWVPGLAEVPWAWWAWGLCFLLDDYAYYWFHRLSHQSNAAWAAHAVHHQSEEYNLTVALRQSSFQALFSWPFYLPIALLGFPWQMLVACHAVNLIYQFWIHTRLVGRMGPLEWVLNTPSHHRVHHAKNPRYCDKNHAGVFILWDRLHGTFVPEGEEVPVYGTTVPLRSWNPLWANVVGFWHLAQDAWHTHRWQDKVRVWFMPPGWRPADRGGPIRPQPVSVATFQKFTTPAPARRNAYLAVHFVLLVPAVFAVLLGAGGLSVAQQLVALAAVGVTLAALGGLAEAAPWALPLERLRLLSLALAAAATLVLPWLGAAPLPPQATWLAVGVLALAGASLLLLPRVSAARAAVR